MSRFTEKASKRIDRMSDEQLSRIINSQANELQLRDFVLENVDEGVLVCDSSMRVVYTNRHLPYLLETNRKRKSQLVSSYVKNAEVLEFIRQCVEKHLDSKEFLYTHTTQQNNKTNDMTVRILSLTNVHSDLVGFRFMDFTFIDKFVKEFRKNEALASMTTMAAGVAHEIKNPLASISIYLQLLSRQLDKKGMITKDEAKSSISVISQEIERLNRIAVDFLFAVRPMNVQAKLSDLNEVARKTISVCEPEVSSNAITLVQDLATSLPNVLIDPNLIQQCILNLVRNSIQAFDERSAERKITVNTYLDGDSVKLSVSDTGCGMTEDQMARIFEPYFTTKAQGTGLGLTTIFKIMKEHGGEITVNSEIGQGSVFTMRIPVPKSERLRLVSR